MNAPAQKEEKLLRWENVNSEVAYATIRRQVTTALEDLVSHKDEVHGAMTIVYADVDMRQGLMAPGLVLTENGLALKDDRNLMVIVPSLLRRLGKAIGLNVKCPRQIEFIKGSWLYIYVTPDEYADIAERFKLSAKDINKKTAELTA